MVSEDLVSKVVEEAYKKALLDLPEDIHKALKEAWERESDPLAKKTLGILLENVRIAKEKSTTICQDTGVPEFLIKMGLNFRFEGDFERAIKKGIRNLTKNFPLVPLVVH
jgi:tartrate dehydratase alpha subunit/fumarate hydratase class I-like protein